MRICHAVMTRKMGPCLRRGDEQVWRRFTPSSASFLRHTCEGRYPFWERAQRWTPAYAGVTKDYSFIVIPAKAGIHSAIMCVWVSHFSSGEHRHDRSHGRFGE